MIARSRRTRSLNSTTQLSSSVTGCELGMSDIAPRSVAKKPGTLSRRRRHRRRRMRVDIDQPAVDLAIGRPAVDRRDRVLERPVVEHRAVDEGRRRRVDVGLQVLGKLVGDEFRAPRPGAEPLARRPRPSRRSAPAETRPGNDEVARAAKASAGALSRSKSLSTSPFGCRR